MEKRGFKFKTYSIDPVDGYLYGDEVYNTSEKGWTLTEWEFTEPALIENYIDIPGRLDGPIDASTALTNGDPRYGQRKLTATFECSEGTRDEREALLINMRNILDGRSLNIYFPDTTIQGYHATGRVRVERLYNDLAHASVRVTAICEPWLYKIGTKIVPLQSSTSFQSYTLKNNGRRRIVPTVKILDGSTSLMGEGDGGLSKAPHSMGVITRSAGTYQLRDFYILPGETFSLTYSGTGTIKLMYREAIL